MSPLNLFINQYILVYVIFPHLLVTCDVNYMLNVCSANIMALFLETNRNMTIYIMCILMEYNYSNDSIFHRTGLFWKTSVAMLSSHFERHALSIHEGRLQYRVVYRSGHQNNMRMYTQPVYLIANRNTFSESPIQINAY